MRTDENIFTNFQDYFDKKLGTDYKTTDESEWKDIAKFVENLYYKTVLVNTSLRLLNNPGIAKKTWRRSKYKIEIYKKEFAKYDYIVKQTTEVEYPIGDITINADSYKIDISKFLKNPSPLILNATDKKKVLELLSFRAKTDKNYITNLRDDRRVYHSPFVKDPIVDTPNIVKSMNEVSGHDILKRGIPMKYLKSLQTKLEKTFKGTDWEKRSSKIMQKHIDEKLSDILYQINKVNASLRTYNRIVGDKAGGAESAHLSIKSFTKAHKKVIDKFTKKYDYSFINSIDRQYKFDIGKFLSGGYNEIFNIEEVQKLEFKQLCLNFFERYYKRIFDPAYGGFFQAGGFRRSPFVVNPKIDIEKTMRDINEDNPFTKEKDDTKSELDSDTLYEFFLFSFADLIKNINWHNYLVFHSEDDISDNLREDCISTINSIEENLVGNVIKKKDDGTIGFDVNEFIKIKKINNGSQAKAFSNKDNIIDFLERNKEYHDDEMYNTGYGNHSPVSPFFVEPDFDLSNVMKDINE